MMRRVAGLVGAAVLAVVAAASGQDAPSQAAGGGNGGGSRSTPALEAVRISGAEPRLDGIVDEDVWRSAPVAGDFVQLEPDEGEPASERTEARVLYGEDALFVAFQAFDSDPDSVVGQLTRRDQSSYSDWVHVLVDSYFDRRTAFQFSVNPRGVKQDTYRFDDTNEDSGWDPVWDVAVHVGDFGWSAEFRIPYSQLRFANLPVQTWGINFGRQIARRQELSTWAPLESRENRMVSLAGELRGLEGLGEPRRLELQPYSLARLDRPRPDPDNPFYDANAVAFELGGDLKYGVTNNLTLDVTVNPDFGQVEADPAQVNLTAFESFFSERRPFFVEGANIFSFRLAQGDGDGSAESLFYSRRIGRSPQGWADPQGGWVDRPDQTRILGAWKLSGKTRSGVSIGVLHAVTGEEKADVVTGEGEELRTVIEPFSNYGVVRVQKDFRDGESAVGVIGTVVNRSPEAADALSLRTGAYTGGVDARHRFGGGNWQVEGSLIGSYIRGSAEAIELAQRSPARYFQRPDADHVELDPTRTGMAGWSGMYSIGKLAGGFWRFATGGTVRSPGFETNDLGFMNSTDYYSPWLWAGYHHSTPAGPFLRYFLNANAWSSWTLGGERENTGGNVNGSFTLRNYWSGYVGVNRQLGGTSASLLRGGPLFRVEPGLNGWFGASSDHRKAIQVNLNNSWNRRSESESWTWATHVALRWRPSGRATMSVGPFVTFREEGRQWVRRMTLEEQDHYVFGRLDQTTAGLTARVDYAFTPDLTVQLYAQPFVSSGRYTDFKAVADPQADAYADRFRALAFREGGNGYLADVDGNGVEESFSDPDFTFQQFRSNVVVRWEYRPGSTLFLVWSQGRNDSTGDGTFRLRQGFDDLFSIHPDNVFMVKVSYWLNP